MSKVWEVEVRHSTFEHLAYPTADCEEPISVTHFLRQVSSNPDRDIGIYGGRVNTDNVQSAELIMLREDFEDDYFTWGGCKFASERLRNAMALETSVVEFLEVDDSKSAALPRSKNYQIMAPTMSEDVSDRAKSRYQWQHRIPKHFLTDLPEGFPPLRPEQLQRLLKPLRIRPKKGDVPPYVRRIAIRPDAAPECDLFYDNFFGMTLLCTDALALRVLKANCTGIVFVDPIGYREGARVRRTVDGVEDNFKD